MGTTTTLLGLYKPDIDEVGWGALRNDSFDDLDTAVGTQHGANGVHRFVTCNDGTGYVKFPELTTIQRDALPAAAGMTVYNTDLSLVQTYQGGTWQSVVTASLVVEEQDLAPSVSAVSTIRFPNGTVTDIGGGIVSIAGFVQDSEGVAVGDILYFDGGNWARIAPGAATQILQTNGAGVAPTWVNAVGGGNVSAALSITDNAVVRGDGGATGVQLSGVLIDDSDNVTGIVNLTTTGTVTFNGVTYTFPGADGAGVLTSNGAGVLSWAAAGSVTVFADDVFRIQDNGDATKELAFEVAAITTGTTRTITVPDTDVDLGNIATNNSKVTNATHSGDATGDGALTAQPALITGKGAATVASGDLVLVADIDDSNNLKQVTAQSIGDLGGGGGATLTEDVAQATHGFSVNDWVYHNGTIYALADASAAGTAESIGIVSAVADAGNFTLQFGGKITGLTGLTAGEAHFLSETAGAITATAPTTNGAVVKPVLIADTTTSGFIFNMRGSEITDTSSRVVSFVDGDLTAGVLTVNHAFGNQYVQVQIFDNSDILVIPDDVTLTDANNLDVDLTSYGTLTGTYHAVILDTGGTFSGTTANDLSLTGQAAEDFAIFDGANWVAKGGIEKIANIESTRNLTTATGNVAYTGVGFKPSYVVAHCVVNSGNGMSIGSDDGTSPNAIYIPFTATRVISGTTNLILADATGGSIQYATVNSFDVDGFTLAWTKVGSPSGLLVMKFTAFR